MYDGAISTCEVTSEQAIKIIEELKPGSHFMVICKPTNYHHIACIIEDAGFEIRDQLIWLKDGGNNNIVMARKPLSENTVASNVLKYGTGAINIDYCRIATGETLLGGKGILWSHIRDEKKELSKNNYEQNKNGRFPANILHDGSEVILKEFEKYGETKSGVDISERGTGGIWGKSSGKPCGPQHGDSGYVSRFFKELKDHNELIEYLFNMIIPPNGDCLILK